MKMSGQTDFDLSGINDRSNRYVEMLKKLNITGSNNDSKYGYGETSKMLNREAAITRAAPSICESNVGQSMNNTNQHFLSSKSIQQGSNTASLYSVPQFVKERLHSNQPNNQNDASLSTHQFYQRGPNTNLSTNQSSQLPTGPTSVTIPSTYTPSERSFLFKAPQSTRQFNTWMQYKTRVELMCRQLSEFDNKDLLKFIVRLMEESVHYVTCENPPFPINPVLLLNNIAENIKAKYYAGRVPKSISGASSIISDLSTTLRPDHEIVLDYNHSTNNQIPTQPVQVPFSRPPVRPRKIQTKKLSVVLDDSAIELFNDSQLAQQRDERAIQNTGQNSRDQSRTAKVKATPRPTNTTIQPAGLKSEAATSKQCKAVTKSDSFLPNESQRVSRTGRVIKCPVQYWKGNDSMVNNSVDEKNGRKLRGLKEIQNCLDSSITLRSHKVVNRVSPQLNNENSTNTSVSKIGKYSTPIPKKPQTKRKPRLKQDKENTLEGAPKPKKISNKTLKSDQNEKTTSKVGARKKKNLETSKQPDEEENHGEKTQTEKKATNKRKSKGTADSVSKKKKIEESSILPETSDDPIMSSDDELFGAVTHRKLKQPAFQGVSPTTGILSARKAAGVALSKETPPCKSLGQMMNESHVSVVSSVAKEAPITKQDKVVKRVTKTMENKKKTSVAEKNKKKPVKKQDEELQKFLNQAVKPCTAVTTPLSTVFTVFHSEEPESDEENAISDDDDLR